MELDEQYWNKRYLTNDTGWDIGAPSAPLAAYIDQLTDKKQAILIPGGGNSYEAGYLLQNGFINVTVADISAVVCDNLKQQYAQYVNNGLTVIHADFFDLTYNFDLVLEQTFFCALDPSLRRDYADQMYELLEPKGKLAGVLFNRDFEGGPPFGGNVAEYRELFAEKFTINTMEPCYNSIAPRAGNEVFINLSVRR